MSDFTLDANADGIGDFQGLMRRLDYLHGLGIPATWLMPFQKSPGKDDGYDISDYYAGRFHRIHAWYETTRHVRPFSVCSWRRNQNPNDARSEEHGVSAPAGRERR